MTAVKEDLIRNNNTINWIPESIGKGRFGDWLENIQDWGIIQKPLLGNSASTSGSVSAAIASIPSDSIEELK